MKNTRREKKNIKLSVWGLQVYKLHITWWDLWKDKFCWEIHYE